MATILAHIQVKPGSEKKFEEIARALYDGTHTHEKNVKRYEYWKGAAPGLYYTLLSFDDYHGFLEHQSSDHHETAAAGLGEVIQDLKLEWVNPLEGASPLSQTAMQDLPENANDLVKRYFETMPAEVQDWWAA